MSVIWHPDGTIQIDLQDDDSPDPPGIHHSDEPPPRHSVDDYRAIAERLKTLGYRGWITG